MPSASPDSSDIITQQIQTRTSAAHRGLYKRMLDRSQHSARLPLLAGGVEQEGMAADEVRGQKHRQTEGRSQKERLVRGGGAGCWVRSKEVSPRSNAEPRPSRRRKRRSCVHPSNKPVTSLTAELVLQVIKDLHRKIQ